MTKFPKLDRPEVLQYIFAPRKEEKSPLPANAFDVQVDVEEDVTLGCRFYMCSEDAPNILYFHGNGETVYEHNEIGYMYNKHGMNLLVASYRGYADSTGTPTVEALLGDCHKLFSFSQNWLKENGYNGEIFVMGRSLGSASAIELVWKNLHPVKALIIESGFGEMLPLAKNFGIEIDEDFGEHEGFNNLAKIQQVEIPTFILHGAKDSLIPLMQAERLQSYCGAKSKQFQIIPGADHNTMIATGGDIYFQVIGKFINTLLGAYEWRKRRRQFKQEHK